MESSYKWLPLWPMARASFANLQPLEMGNKSFVSQKRALRFYALLRYVHGIPSAVISCILQQADIMRIANLSTTKIRHSLVFGFNAGVFPLKRITSFIISVTHQKKTTKQINVRINGKWPNVNALIQLRGFLRSLFAWKIDIVGKAISHEFIQTAKLSQTCLMAILKNFAIFVEILYVIVWFRVK